MSPFELRSSLSQPNSAASDFLSPFDGSVLARVQKAGMMDVVQSLASIKKAQQESAESSLEERAVWLESIATRLENNIEEYSFMEASFEALPQSFVREHGYLPMIRLARQIADQLRQKDSSLVRPVGLISVIAPAPLAIRSIGERLFPALAAGNAVLVKVPSGSPITSQIFSEATQDLPSGLASFWLGEGAELGNFLATHPSIRAVSFAGHPLRAGKVLSAASSSWKKWQISSGMKNALLVLPDFDLSHISELLPSLLLGQGRLGWGLSRIFVTEAFRGAFVESLNAALKTLKPMTSAKDTSPWGPLPSGAREAAMSLLPQAVSDQGKVTSELADSDRHWAPRVVTDLSNCSVLQLEELPAPLLIVNSVKYAHEMAKWTNTGDYGFAASIYGNDESARKMALKLDVGRVWLNGWMQGDDAFAGWRKSFAGNPDFRWDGSFFSDVKSLIPPRD